MTRQLLTSGAAEAQVISDVRFLPNQPRNASSGAST
jgi:hypothetical protein